MAESKLRITEIFYSLQGETINLGLPTVFIRLTGCPLRCQYCDTAYAFTGGQWMQLSEIMAQISRYKTPYVTVTGGEPLAQPECITLLAQLCDQNYQVSLETSGALPLASVDGRVRKIMDIKTPDSQEAHRNDWHNLQCLDGKDQVKFVICSEQDYLWSKQQLMERQLNETCEVLLSPSHEQLMPAQLAEWILEDQLPVRFQMQLHKVLWGDQRGK